MKRAFRVVAALSFLVVVSALSPKIAVLQTPLVENIDAVATNRPLFQAALEIPLIKIAELYDPKLLNAAQGIRAYPASPDHQAGLLAVASGYLNGADLYDLKLRPIWLKPYRQASGDLTLFADVVRLKDGRFAYTDFKGHRIVVLDSKGVELAQWGVGLLHLPIGIDQFDDGEIIVADYGNDVLRVLTPQGQLLRTVANPGGLDVRQPYDVRIRSDKLYLVDRQRHRILKLDREFNLLRTFEKAPDGTFLFDHPQHIDFDSSGRLYVMDTRSNSVKVIDPESGEAVAKLTHPDIYADRGIAIDGDDRIHIAGFRKAALADDGNISEDEAGIMVFAPLPPIDGP